MMPRMMVKHFTIEKETLEGFRSFSLPDTVDEERVDASFKDGVLTITLHGMKITS